MSAALVLRDAAIDAGLPLPLPSDLPTLLHAHAMLHGGVVKEIALLDLDAGIVPRLRKKIRSSARKIPIEVVREALRWHVLCTAEILQAWGPEGDLASPRWKVDTLLRWDRFVARLWHPHSPRISIRWATKESDSRLMSPRAKLQTLALWRLPLGPLQRPPRIEGWADHTPARFAGRARLMKEAP